MKNADYIFVEVTKIYLVSPEQAKQALTAARNETSDVTFFSQDPDGTELAVSGDDYLQPDGTPDVAAAIADIEDPVGTLGIEEIQTTSQILRIDQVR